MKAEEIAQWVIDKRCKLSEVSDHEIYHTILDAIRKPDLTGASLTELEHINNAIAEEIKKWKSLPIFSPSVVPGK